MLRFFTLDVFTERALTGNPLAVVFQTNSLDAAAMQRIAAEFNLPETVFLTDPSASEVPIRIFTPRTEVPFAGHPIIGTAALLADQTGASAPREVTLVTSAGPVACRAAAAGGVSWAEFTTSKAPTETPFNADLNQLAAMMGIAPSMIGGGGRQPSIFGTGLDIVFVPVISIDALRQIRIETSHWNYALPAPLPRVLAAYSPISAGPLQRIRVFAPLYGTPEDPATGGAAAAIGGVFARFSDLPDGDHHVEIHQGHEIGRPSVITLDFTIRHGRSEPARIGGRAVIVQEGWLRYPGAFSQHSEPV